MSRNETYAQASKLPPTPDNPFIRLAEAQQRTRDLCSRVQRFADEVLGGTPEADAAGERSGSPYGGLIGGLESGVSRINGALEDAETAMRRLEAVMGPF